MELREARSLIALGETGSIRKAARDCHLSPGAVHKHLKTLEEEFGVALYEKRNGSLRLSEAAMVALPFFRQLLVNHDSALQAVHDWDQGRPGRVRIGAGPGFSSYLLPALLKRFRRLSPHAEVYVETGDSERLLAHLTAGELDLIFDVSSPALEDEGMETLDHWDALLGFVAARGQLPPHSTLRELERMPFISFRKGTEIDSIVQNFLASQDFRPNVVMRSDSSEAIKAMVRAGMGISVLFLWNVGGRPLSSGLSVIRTDAPPLSARMALVRTKSSGASRAVTEFVRLVGATRLPGLVRIPLSVPAGSRRGPLPRGVHKK